VTRISAFSRKLLSGYCISVETPVFSSPVEATARPPKQSTMYAETVPCSVPLEFIWVVPSGSRAVTLPCEAEVRSMLERRKVYIGLEGSMLDQ